MKQKMLYTEVRIGKSYITRKMVECSVIDNDKKYKVSYSEALAIAQKNGWNLPDVKD